ncbi:MAG: flagellar biosynthetic protein FliQ [Kofleriaceae bacterium]|nr:flagellar biosynthetic protein FliQ [Kofleriaceae bacterium]MBP6840921.1 flagellar biosynthetic protein FliQ [Kofleriaceae bacterium]
MSAALLALAREGVLLALVLVAPVLLAALAAGVVTGLIRAVTQVDDPAVALVPRVAAVAVAVVLMAPAIGRAASAFAGKALLLVQQVGLGG